MINTIAGLAWFVFFTETTAQYLGYMSSLIFTHVLTVSGAFILYRKYVFKVSGHFWSDLWKFETVNIASLCVNALLLPLMVTVLHISPIPSQFIIVFITTVIGFFGNKYFAFWRKTFVHEDSLNN